MISKTTLENGIRIITEPMKDSRSVSIGFLVTAGPKDELHKQSGLAHLCEHMLFQGTGSRTSSEIYRMMDESGGQIGGFTTRDYTCFSATTLDDYMPYSLDLFGDLFLNSIFPEPSIANEKNAIGREIDETQDSPDEWAHDHLKSMVWKGSALGRSIVGDPDDVKRLTREDVIYFIHQHYHPSRMIISAAGNIIHDDFVAQVRDGFWRMMGDSLPARIAGPEFKTGIVIEHRPLKSAYFSIGFRALPFAHNERYMIHSLNKIIGGGTSSRLFMRIREEKGLVYRIGSEYYAYQEDGIIVIEGSTTPEYIINTLGLILVELWKLASQMEPVTDEELWKANMQIKAQHLMASESSHTRMSRLAVQELYFDKQIDEDETIANIDTCTTESMNRFLGKHFAAMLATLSVAVVGPEEMPCDKEAVQDVLDSFATQ